MPQSLKSGRVHDRLCQWKGVLDGVGSGFVQSIEFSNQKRFNNLYNYEKELQIKSLT